MLTVYVAAVSELDYLEFTIQWIAKYCERCGYDLKIITDPPLDNRHPTWQKLRAAFMHDFSGGSCMVMDADMMPLPWAPPIHKQLSTHRLSLTQIGLSKRAQKRFKQLEIEQRYWFNDSLIGITESTAPFLRKVYDKTPDAATIPYAEMAAICRRLQLDGIAAPKINVIPSQFDYLAQKPNEFSHLRRDSAYFLHFAGPDRKKRDLAQKAHDCFFRKAA